MYEDIVKQQKKIVVVGLGYVGMPIAVEFAKAAQVIGFDVDKKKIEKYQQGIDPTHEVGDAIIRHTAVEFTNDESRLEETSFFIIAVPTPINIDKTPDLAPVISASRLVGKHMKKGSIVVYESTVYPGVTEGICKKILEEESGYVCGKEFWIGYSPERINPGDRVHRLTNIKKIVSGMDKNTLDEIAKIYELVVEAGVHRAPSIKVAEAAKVVENSQRDINIAFMNELAIVFDKMGIDTKEVVEAMNTKWNALRFYPGLVGGHCIGVDPYYFVYQAEKLGYHSQIILSGRKINDDMGAYIAEAAIKKMICAGQRVKNARVGVFGISFKENCPDIRNSKVNDILLKLREYHVIPIVFDPKADLEGAKKEYGIDLKPLEQAKDLDCAIFAVAHTCFNDYTCNMDKLAKLYRAAAPQERVLIDVKGIFNRIQIEECGYAYWRL